MKLLLALACFFGLTLLPGQARAAKSGGTTNTIAGSGDGGTHQGR